MKTMAKRRAAYIRAAAAGVTLTAVAVPLAYIERGHMAVGGEWLMPALCLMVAYAVKEEGKWL